MAQVASAALAAVVERTFSRGLGDDDKPMKPYSTRANHHLFRVRHGASVEAERRASGLRSRPCTQTLLTATGRARRRSPRRIRMGGHRAALPGGYAEYKRSSRRGLTNKLGASGNSPDLVLSGQLARSVAILRTSRFAAIIGIKAGRRSTVIHRRGSAMVRPLAGRPARPRRDGDLAVENANGPECAPWVSLTSQPASPASCTRSSRRLRRDCHIRSTPTTRRSPGERRRDPLAAVLACVARLGRGAAVHCVCAAGVPAQDFEVRVTYARATGQPTGDARGDGRGRVCLVRRSLPGRRVGRIRDRPAHQHHHRRRAHRLRVGAAFGTCLDSPRHRGMGA